MTEKLQFLHRHQIDTDAWDACVAASPQRIMYGYSWYLDAVLPDTLPNGPAPACRLFRWAGLVLQTVLGQYEAVMPVPLRRKTVLGIHCGWVVHQPLFCQFLGVFSRDATLDPTPFFRAMEQRFRYGSRINLFHYPHHSIDVDLIRQLKTHVLDLSAGYEPIYRNYSRDRKRNLRRGQSMAWLVTESTEAEPLLTLFRDHHANNISGGVADRAYVIFRNLTDELRKRGFMTLRYARCGAQIEAGALFVQEGNRIIYLFNAASEAGRRGNARTLLIDQVIRENASQQLILDFESPEKPSIRAFYRSFGAREEPFWTVRWNRLNPIERMLLALVSKINGSYLGVWVLRV